MHLVLPFAAVASQAGSAALNSLRLPRLERLLARLSPTVATHTGADSLNPPHEHVLAACRGWSVADGYLPWAAWMARLDGLVPADPDQGWGLLTPTHWQVGTEQIVLLDPAQLQLQQDESRALFQAVRSLFEPEGWALHWGAPLRWYATHASLAGLATASLDRVVGRAIDRWLPDRQAGRTLRRLQSEAQMLLYTHPVNLARESRGELPVNSFWLSGTGPTPQAASGDTAADPVVDERLRGPCLAEDWTAWAEAWHALDAQCFAELDARAARGDMLSLTLCGEQAAQRFDTLPRGTWQRLTQRWRHVAAVPLLERL